MQTESFAVENVKCGGCVETIRNGLLELQGVEEVDVAIDSGKVTVKGEGLSRDGLTVKLGELGYPEANA